MHSLLILGVYLCMLFAPCAVAQWGDVLTLPQFNFLSRRRRRRALDPVFAELEEAFATAELRRVMREAFVAPAALPGFGTAPATFAAALEAIQQRDSFTAAAERVAARLAQLSAARKQSLAPQPVIAAETRTASIFAPPVPVAFDSALTASAPLAVPAMPAAGISLLPQLLTTDAWLVSAATDAMPAHLDAEFPFANAPMPAMDPAVTATRAEEESIFFEEDERIAA